jgi:S1-C subfamily serine protease
MKTKHVLAAVIVAIVIPCTLVAWASAQSKGRAANTDRGAEAVFQAARKYTVRIRTRIERPFIEDHRGSFEGAGFLVDAGRRWIVTNAHVVGQSPSNVEVAFADRRFQPATKVYVDPFADVAVVTVDEIPAGLRAPELSGGEDVPIGEPVGVFGHPLGMYFTGTRGIISNKTDQAGPDLLQTDATVDHGNSGGPVISLTDGRIIGIATAGAMGQKTDRLNFATPMKDVCRILALLRAGASPSPPRMEIALLINDEDRQTMVVARSFDSRRWPLEPQDRILGVGGASGELKTITDLVSALRGRTGSVPLMIERRGRRQRVEIDPEPRPLTVDRRALVLDGALIAPASFDDEVSLREPWRLVVQSVEPGSAAEMLGLEQWDVIKTVDGRSYDDLDSLATHLGSMSADAPVHVVLARTSPVQTRIDDYHVRDLPGKDIAMIGPETAAIVAKKE